MPIPMTIDLTTLIQLLQYAFSLVGILALARWLVEFISTFTAKQKELADIDKSIREALKDAWSIEKEQRKQDAELFSINVAALQKRLESVRILLADKRYEIAQLRIRNEFTDIVNESIYNVGEDFCNEFSGKAYDTFRDAVMLLANEGKLGAKSLEENIRGAPDLPRSDNVYERLVYFCTQLFINYHNAEYLIMMLTALPKAALQDYDKNNDPDRLLSDIIGATFLRLESTVKTKSIPQSQVLSPQAPTLQA